MPLQELMRQAPIQADQTISQKKKLRARLFDTTVAKKIITAEAIPNA